MNNKINISLASLSNWTGKLLHEGKKGSSDPTAFASEYNVDEYLKFYRELLPFVSSITHNDNTELRRMKDNFPKQLDDLERTLAPSRFLVFELTDTYHNHRSMAETLLALQDIKDNCDNILYQLSLIDD